MGFCLKAYSFDPMPYATWKNILLSTVCSAVCFYIVMAFRLVGQISLLPVELPHFYVLLKATDFFRSFYTISATAALYLFCMRIVYIKHITLPQRLVNLTGMCFGVYLFQEIILMYMYYHTPSSATRQSVCTSLDRLYSCHDSLPASNKANTLHSNRKMVDGIAMTQPTPSPVASAKHEAICAAWKPFRATPVAGSNRHTTPPPHPHRLGECHRTPAYTPL